MSVTFKQFVFGAGMLLAGVGGYLIWQGNGEATVKPARNSALVVKTALAEKKSIPITLQSNGYVTAIDTVDIRPQVQNVVRAVHVKEGQEVRAGQLLFTLDERNDLSNVEKARAQLARDRADLADAEITLKRNQELLARNFVSSAVVDGARNKVESLRSAVRANEAAAQSSNIVLGYNRISASISGRIGAISVHPGSMAQPAGEPLLTISKLDPIAVAFSVPERELAHITATYRDGKAPVVAQLAGGRELAGELVFIDNSADQQSGTIKMKARFANQDRLLWPGAYVNVRLVVRALPDAVVLPAQAVVVGPSGTFVYAVQNDDTVKIQKIEVAAIESGLAAVSGVPVGTRVVVEGTQNLRPGSKVKEVDAAPNATKQGKSNP